MRMDIMKIMPMTPETKLDIVEALLLLIGLGACLSLMYVWTLLLSLSH